MKAGWSSMAPPTSSSTPTTHGSRNTSPDPSALARLPLLISHARHHQKRIARPHIRAQPIHPSNRMQVFRQYIRSSRIDKFIFDIDRNHPAQNDSRPADLHSRELSAFKRCLALRVPRHLLTL